MGEIKICFLSVMAGGGGGIGRAENACILCKREDCVAWDHKVEDCRILLALERIGR